MHLGQLRRGPGYDDRLIGIIEDKTGVGATTTTTAVIRALRALQVSRIALATPYIDEVTRLEVGLGKPVISSNQAIYADCLRILGVDGGLVVFGSLFERLRAPDPTLPPAPGNDIAAE
ncbi:MAG: hypothetical protein ACTSVG_15105 [Alphaproteobacteria bacterium]